MNLKQITLGGVCLALTGLTATQAADWPYFGGDGSRNMANSTEKNIPTDIVPGKLAEGQDKIDLATTQNIKWVAKMGSQTYGNTIVVKGKVIIGTNNDGGTDPRFKGDYSVLKCLDEKTGKLLWQLTVPKLGSGKVNDWEYLGICSSAAADGDRVYITTNRCDVVCLDLNGLANGNDGDYKDEGKYMAGTANPPVEVQPHDADILWVFDMVKELNVFQHNAAASSPLIVGDNLYVATANGVDWSHTNIPSPKAPSLICLDKKTGKFLGEEITGASNRILHCNWSSPSHGKVNGKDQIFFSGPDGWVYAFEAAPVQDKEGGFLKEIWRFDANPPSYRTKDGKPIKYARPDGPSEVIASPVFYNGKVYVEIGQDPEHGEGIGNYVCIDPAKGTGDVTKTAQIWSFDKINRGISTSGIVNDLVFTGDYSGFIYCFDAKTGALLWKHDSLSHIWGSPLVVDGKVYIGNEDGDLLIFQAGREKKLIKSINFGDAIYSTPVAANGVLYIGTATQLFAVEQK